MIFEQPGRYPSLAAFLDNGGRLEIGYIYELGVSVIAFDEGGVVWEGKEKYESLDVLLAEAEKAIVEWIGKNW
ncbi:MAG: hypothetical protein CSB48_02575 [Proteobacteria bacterium]|nr:MAG: hypothetical protein CSB48_02575 [Pseudomonadota bacterium]